MPDQRDLLHDLASTTISVQKAFSDQIGMSRARLSLLTSIATRPERSQAELRRDLGLDGASLTRLVKELEAMGLVTRRRDPHDNRYTLVSATTRGRRTLASAVRDHHAFVSELLADVSERDAQVVTRVLRSVRARLAGLR